MTRAMGLPMGFGKYFLDGDYVGWEEVLEAHFEALSAEEKEKYHIDGPTAYARNVSGKFKLPIASEANEFRGVPPLRDYECPKEFAIQFLDAKEHGSLIKLSDMLLAVDEALKTIIEDLEPDVHQFWPIKITMRDGSPHSKPYFGIRIGQFLDSFRPEKTPEAVFHKRYSSYLIDSFAKKKCAAMAFSKDAIGAAHLWRERRLDSPEVFYSDTLMARISEAGLDIPKVLMVKDV